MSFKARVRPDLLLLVEVSLDNGPPGLNHKKLSGNNFDQYPNTDQFLCYCGSFGLKQIDANIRIQPDYKSSANVVLWNDYVLLATSF